MARGDIRGGDNTIVTQVSGSKNYHTDEDEAEPEKISRPLHSLYFILI